jgi:hypothetical protein
MVRYKIIKELKEKTNFTQLVASGVVSLTIATWFQIYETYLSEIVKNENSIAVQFTADHYNVSNSQIYKIVSFMSS